MKFTLWIFLIMFIKDMHYNTIYNNSKNIGLNLNRLWNMIRMK